MEKNPNKQSGAELKAAISAPRESVKVVEKEKPPPAAASTPLWTPKTTPAHGPIPHPATSRGSLSEGAGGSMCSIG